MILMASDLSIYVILLSISLAGLVFLMIRDNERTAQNLARVRVRVEDVPRRRRPEPPDEEIETSRAPELVIIGLMLLLVGMVLSRV